MKFTKIKKGEYSFKGVDTWTGKEIEGKIINNPFDVKVSQSWSVVFTDEKGGTDRPFFGKSLKECKQWFL